MGKRKNIVEKNVDYSKESEEEDSDDSSVYSGLGDEEEDSSLESDDALINEGNGETVREDEYQNDSSDEEDIRNTVGNIPMKWYDEYQHLGYDWEGAKIPKPVKGDELDKFLQKMENPDYMRTVHDPTTGQDVVLGDEDVEIISRIQKGLYPDKTFDPFAPWIDFFSHETAIHPVTNQPEHKRSFIPSLIEKEKVSKLVHAIKMGWLKPKEKTEKDTEPKFYIMWDHDEQIHNKRFQHYIPAPKLKLPGHEESYNPPPEYLFDKEEEEKWKNAEPEDRKLDFLPQKFQSLREVPAYENFTSERFQRCLDLYLCPRQRKMRLNIDPEELIPKLPKPKDLHPFPTKLSMIYKGHKDMVRCISIEPSGQFFVSGSDDGTIKIWEVQTGRCMRTIKTGSPVMSISWCPNTNMCLVAAAIGKTVVIFNPNVGDKLIISNTNLLFSQTDVNQPGTSSNCEDVNWIEPTQEQLQSGYKLVLEHFKEVSSVTWHCKGDYFATVLPKGASKSIFIHQLSKRRSQQPFKRNKGEVQRVLFHPTRPYFFVATQQHVRIYNLLKLEMTKKLMANTNWITSIAIHSGGDNIIIGSHEARLTWFDLDLSSKPYQTIKHHKKSIRNVAFHKRYPLFASASDDCSVLVCHATVYNDYLQNPLIVPVKTLHGHSNINDYGVWDCQFHPTQPWVFTSGADANIFLFT